MKATLATCTASLATKGHSGPSGTPNLSHSKSRKSKGDGAHPEPRGKGSLPLSALGPEQHSCPSSDELKPSQKRCPVPAVGLGGLGNKWEGLPSGVLGDGDPAQLPRRWLQDERPCTPVLKRSDAHRACPLPDALSTCACNPAAAGRHTRYGCRWARSCQTAGSEATRQGAACIPGR